MISSRITRPIARATSTGAVLAVVVGCTDGPSAPEPLTALPRDLTAAELSVARAGNAFSFNLFRRLTGEQRAENVFVSPLSASMALGMTMTGAAGETFDAMRSTLQFGDDSDQTIKEGYRSLIDFLRSLDRTTDFRIANSIWYRDGMPVLQPFIEDARTYFDAEVAGIDFSAPGAPDLINAWVSRSTEGKIPKIIEAIPPNVVMYLINAIYFKGSWKSAFPVSGTHDELFHATDGMSPVRLMHQESELRYLRTADFQAVDLLYGNSAFTMTVILPHRGVDIHQLAQSIDQSAWNGWMEQFEPVKVSLYLPKVRLEYERRLNDDLVALGMGVAFGPADFSRIVTGGGLAIDEVKHKTFVDIYEEGTEAAAATSVSLYREASFEEEVRVDRPFIFAIRERFSGTILFMGRILKLPPE